MPVLAAAGDDAVTVIWLAMLFGPALLGLAVYVLLSILGYYVNGPKHPSGYSTRANTRPAKSIAEYREHYELAPAPADDVAPGHLWARHRRGNK